MPRGASGRPAASTTVPAVAPVVEMAWRPATAVRHSGIHRSRRTAPPTAQRTAHPHRWDRRTTREARNEPRLSGPFGRRRDRRDERGARLGAGQPGWDSRGLPGRAHPPGPGRAEPPATAPADPVLPGIHGAVSYT